MKLLYRFFTALTFYPIFVLWFIPSEAFRAYRKSKRISGGDLKQAKAFFLQEVQVALSYRKRAVLSKKEKQAIIKEHIKNVKSMTEVNDEEFFK